MPSGKVSVYCHMSSQGLGSCSGGGWTLVMKIDGRKVSQAIFFSFLFFSLISAVNYITVVQGVLNE